MSSFKGRLLGAKVLKYSGKRLDFSAATVNREGGEKRFAAFGGSANGKTLHGRARRQAFLLSGAAVGAVWMALGGVAVADDACVTSGTTLICTGDQSDGIMVGNPFEVLEVNALNGNIEPASGVSGIDFQADGPISIISDLGTRQVFNGTTVIFDYISNAIVATDADGIVAISSGGSVSIDHTGDIESNERGIFAQADGGSADITVNGDIDAGGTGVEVLSSSSDASVELWGDVTSQTGRGIQVHAPDGSASLVGGGQIWSEGDGIFAEATGDPGDSTVEWTGDISSQSGRGVYSYAARGLSSVMTQGDIDASDDGIFSTSTSEGTATVDHQGSIVAGSRGVYAYSAREGVSVTVADGDIFAGSTAIYAYSDSDADGVTVNLTGNITASTRGIDASAARGAIDVTVNGDIYSTGEGIFTQNLGNEQITIDQTGGLYVGGRGIYANTPNGFIDITSNGPIDAGSDGIFALNSGNEGIAIDSQGMIDAGGRGIYAESVNGAIDIFSDGAIDSNSDGIFAQNSGNEGIDIESQGNIDAGGKGIYAASVNGAISIMSEGSIDASSDGFFAMNIGDGDISISSLGDIDVSGRGIYAESPRGVITVDSDGNISASSFGIFAKNNSGDGAEGVTVTSIGNIDAGSKGIYTESLRGFVTVETTGDILSSSDGIFAQNDSNDGEDGVLVTSMGDIDAGAKGIYGKSTRGFVTIESTGDIMSSNQGIFAQNDSNTGQYGISITSMGDIDAGSDGIYGYSTRGFITIDGAGDITSSSYGIFAQNDSNTGEYGISITNMGNIDAGSKGIYGYSTRGFVAIESTGDILSSSDGIFAQNDSSAGGYGIRIISMGDIEAGTKGIYGYSTRGGVVVESTGDILSSSDGIFAQNDSDTGEYGVSISSFGDIDSGAMGIYGFSTMGAVTVVSEGNIESEGSGIVAINQGEADAPVSVTHSGNINSVTGAGIVASSVNGEVAVTLNDGVVTAAADGISVEGYNDLSVTVNENSSVTGASGSAGVLFSIGLENTLMNYGTIDNAGGFSDYAVLADGNNINVSNFGTISGNVKLGPWVNIFNNYEGALFNTGELVDLNSGFGNVLQNAGTVSPGGVGNLLTTELIGSLNNGETGKLLFDVDMVGSGVDRINVSEEASLDGGIALNFMSVDGNPYQETIITTVDGITDQSLTLLNPIVVGDILYTNGGDDAELSISGFDFSPTGISSNASAIGGYIGESIDGGSIGLDPIALALLNLQSLAEVDDALNQLSPNMYMSEQLAAVQDSLGFSDSLLSCRVAGGVAKFGAEGQCVWGRGTYRNYQQSSSGDYTGFESQSYELAGGAQFALGSSDWRLGGALGMGIHDRTGDGGATSEGNSVLGGIALKYVPGPWLFAGAVSGSYGSYDTTRQVAFVGFSDTLTGKPDSGTVNGRLRAAYTMQQGEFYLKPQADVNLTYLYSGAFTETGGIASISSDSNSNTVFSFSPSFEIGGEVAMQNGVLVRPYMRGGVSFYSNSDITMQGRFVADTSGANPFSVTNSSDDVIWNLAAGVDLLNVGSGNLRVFYEGQFGDKTTINSGGAKLSLDF